MKSNLMSTGRRVLCRFVLAILLIAGLFAISNAQMAGSRGGAHPYQPVSTQAPNQSTTIDRRVTDYISVGAEVELRVVPDQIRIVLAISKNAKTPSECEALVFKKIDELKAAFSKLKIPSDDVVDDFISILPRYKFEIQTQEGQRVAVERLVDYSMQSNLHIKVKDDQQAMQVIRSAFRVGVTDVIGFDYWSKQLDVKKSEALKLALAKSNAKAKLLLDDTFATSPQPINIESSTQVVMPDKLYESFANAHGQSYSQNYNRESLPVIRAIRPKHTYYRGFMREQADRHPEDVPMNCEISILAKVKIHYASPVARDYRELAGPKSKPE